MRDHINILGWVFIASGTITILMAFLMFVVVAGSGAVSGNHHAMYIAGTIGAVIAVISTAVALPNIITGWGLLRHRSWARILALVLGLLQVVAFPFGTLLCVYAFSVLLNQETAHLFEYR